MTTSNSNIALNAALRFAQASKKENPPPSPTKSKVQQSGQVRAVQAGRRCSFEPAFRFLESAVTAQGLTVRYVDSDILEVNPGTNNTFHIDCSSVPCFVESIPELLTIYIVAQLLKMAATPTLERTDVAKRAETNILAKILVLKQMDRHFKGST